LHSANFDRRPQNLYMKYGVALVWCLLTLALMRPQIVDRLTSTSTDGRDLMLAVDISGSMQSLDFSTRQDRVSRLDVAKSVVGDFLKKRGGDRVGLILFGANAFLTSPLTLDTVAVGKMLNNSLPGMAGDATALGDALGVAIKNLRDRPAKSKAVILLTDGDDNASTVPPLEAAKLAQSYGIRIYTIVVGKDGVVPFPDEHGRIVMVESHVNKALTQQIAMMTGGEFYTASNRTKLEQIYERIDTLEKTKSEQQTALIRKPLFQYPAALALICMALLSVFGVTKELSYVF
jgi:Ca-activated chloride channel homolog